jgi:putative transposase
MNDSESLKHTKWECKYHVIFIPKWRKKQIYGQLRRDLGQVLRELARHKESAVKEGH